MSADQAETNEPADADMQATKVRENSTKREAHHKPPAQTQPKAFFAQAPKKDNLFGFQNNQSFGLPGSGLGSTAAGTNDKSGGATGLSGSLFGTNQQQLKDNDFAGDPDELRSKAAFGVDFHRCKNSGWPLRHLLWEWAAVWCQSECGHQYRMGKRAAEDVADILEELHHQQCAICSGLGHHSRVCPTEARLINAGKRGGKLQHLLFRLKQESKVRTSVA